MGSIDGSMGARLVQQHGCYSLYGRLPASTGNKGSLKYTISGFRTPWQLAPLKKKKVKTFLSSSIFRTRLFSPHHIGKHILYQ